MASDETGLALSHRLDSNHHRLHFHDESNSSFLFNPPNQRPGSAPDRSAAGTTSNNDKATRELTEFIDHRHRFYQPEGTTEIRSSMYNTGPVHQRGIQNWHGGNGRSSSPSDDESDGNEEDDDVDAIVISSGNKNNNSTNTSGHNSDKDRNVKMNLIPSIGSSREVLKIGNDLNNTRPDSNEIHRKKASEYQNGVALVDRDDVLYYSQFVHGAEGLGSGFKDTVVENGCGFSGRKDCSYSGESGVSLATILSDPLTGTLMDDAMILPCGHSFGSGGMQHVMKMKACYTCSQPVMDGSVASNLSLRSAVLAFRREEELQVHHTSKRRRERLEQDTINYNDSIFTDTPRGRGLQFPFSVADRVIIKGNKRTPERFVGCEAVVTTQCLNGWYVVKTLNNTESIKLQYRSLAKVSVNSSFDPNSSKITPNWL